MLRTHKTVFSMNCKDGLHFDPVARPSVTALVV